MVFYVFLDIEADTGSSVLQVCTMAAAQRYVEQRFWVVPILGQVFQWVLVLLHDMVTE